MILWQSTNDLFPVIWPGCLFISRLSANTSSWAGHKLLVSQGKKTYEQRILASAGDSSSLLTTSNSAREDSQALQALGCGSKLVVIWSWLSDSLRKGVVDCLSKKRLRRTDYLYSWRIRREPWISVHPSSSIKHQAWISVGRQATKCLDHGRFGGNEPPVQRDGGCSSSMNAQVVMLGDYFRVDKATTTNATTSIETCE